MNVKLCRIENEILMCIFEELDKPSDAVLCFDGLMILKELEVDLAKLEEAAWQSA